MLGRLFDPILTAIYPQVCHVCRGMVDRHMDGVACAACWSQTNIFDGSQKLCGKCGAVARMGQAYRSGRCGQCEDGLYDAAIACGVYEKALAVTVIRLKKEPYLPGRVDDMLGAITERLLPIENGILIPVPL